jgi:hypothetical protein
MNFVKITSLVKMKMKKWKMKCILVKLKMVKVNNQVAVIRTIYLVDLLH